MAEYYVSPNVSANAAPAAAMNAAPMVMSHGANAAPAMTLPAMVKPMAYGPVSAPCHHPLSMEAILVLFILLVIITRICV